METGFVTLTNTKQYPFNDSEATVALGREQAGAHYAVLTEVIEADGMPERVLVYDKAENGFRLAFTGSAKSAAVRYTVIGGGWQ